MHDKSISLINSQITKTLLYMYALLVHYVVNLPRISLVLKLYEIIIITTITIIIIIIIIKNYRIYDFSPI